MTRIVEAALAAVLAVGVSPAWSQTAQEISYVANGVNAKLTCSGVFVSGRTPDAAALDAATLLGPLGVGIEHALDPEAQSASAHGGGVTRTAFYRPGLGCTLSADGAPPALQSDPRSPGEAAPAWSDAGPGRDVDADAIRAALDAAFPAGADIDTRAFVVVHDGRIVAERYAPGFEPDTPLLGWSMAKSVTATLIGLLIDDGRLSLSDPIAMPGWNEDNPRRAITLEQLLQMSSGLTFTEDYSGTDDASLMLFTRPDMAAYAASKPLEHALGEVWSYSSGTTLMLSRLLIQTLGSPEAVQAYARERLFIPAGMPGAVMEQDMAGTPVGSSYIYATAREWARFGLLYLNGGEIDGRRILSPEWTGYARRPAPAARQANYGAQFWLNGFRDTDRTTRVAPDLPTDTFFASGHSGQIVLIIPSLDVVVVRLGWTTGNARYSMNTVVPPVLEALGLLPAVPTTP